MGVRSGLRQRNSGKGKTDQQARVSGLCEALERYSGIFQGDERRQTARYRELGEAAIQPAACLLFSAAQYRQRQDWNTTNSGYNFVPDPFDEEQAIEWTPVWSLSHHGVKYVPTAFCYYNYPLPPGHRFCRGDSNGNAAGNTLEEAILQGFMELVERDGVALWWYNRVPRPAVDLASFDEAYFQAYTAYYAQRGREVWGLDLTSDLTIPVFAAVSRRTDPAGEALVFGFGAHLDPLIGILRALTEMTQSLGYFDAWETPDASPDMEADLREAMQWWREATLAQHPYLAPAPQVPVRTARQYPRQWSEELRQDVETCVALAAQQGLETLVLEETRPDIGLPVVKVIVPGLRHFWRRLAPGQLYTVPARLGWLPVPLPEEQLNPTSMFL
jgi:ribosomal protein S12 methylthiotransferase accessory factor